MNILSWLNSPQNSFIVNILAGIIASVIVLSFQIVVKAASLSLAALITQKWKLRLLWGLKDIQQVYIVSGSISGVSTEIQSVILAGPDADAASTLLATAGLLYPHAVLHHVYSSSFPPELYKENLIVVGGPVNNSCSAAILANYSSVVSFQNFDLHVIGCPPCETTYNDQNKPIRDHGAIIRAPNPFDRSKSVIVICGCDTHGVLAAALPMSSRPDAKEARTKLEHHLGFRKYFRTQNYVALVECTVLGNDIGHVMFKGFHRIGR